MKSVMPIDKIKKCPDWFLGKTSQGFFYANWGSSQMALSNGDWGEDIACKCYVSYYMA